jgi:hypothetical protein
MTTLTHGAAMKEQEVDWGVFEVMVTLAASNVKWKRAMLRALLQVNALTRSQVDCAEKRIARQYQTQEDHK